MLLPHFSTRFVSLCTRSTNFTRIETEKLNSQQFKKNNSPEEKMSYQNTQLSNKESGSRIQKHYRIFSAEDLSDKAALKYSFEALVQPLFKNCDPDLREYIIGSLVKQATNGDQEEKQLATELLVRLSQDEQLAIPAVNREYLSAAVVEFQDTENKQIAHQKAFDSVQHTLGDWR